MRDEAEIKGSELKEAASVEKGAASIHEAELPFVIALDIGTSSVRASLYDARGRSVAGTEARIVRKVFVSVKGDAGEANADVLIEETLQTLSQTITLIPHELRANVRAVAVSCFWHTLVGVTSDGQPLTPVFGWADTRASQEALWLRAHFNERETHRRTGCRFHASYWPAKLLWLARNKDQIFRSAACWMSFGELLTLRLCGRGAASVSMASGTGLFDQRKLCWDEELTGKLNISADRLPPIAGDKETFAIAEESVKRWPQLAHIAEARVYPAIGDGAANNIGAGCVTTRSVALMIGTSGAMRVLYAGEPLTKLPFGLWCYRADSRRVVIGGALSNGGVLIDWMKSLFAPEDLREASDEQLAAMPPDSHGLTVLPFWAGERSTGWSSSARGAILGITTGTGARDLLRAAMEAVAHRFALIADLLPPETRTAKVVASGGALRASPAWAQILADAIGRPLILTDVREASSRGAALLALERMGAIKDIAEFPVIGGKRFETSRENHVRYREAMRRQQRIYDLLVGDEEIARLIARESQI
jgi:gluconokinase